MTELDYLTTEELIAELASRSPEGMVVGLSREDEWRVEFNGDLDVTLRLTNLLLWEHQQKFMVDDEDE